MEKQKLTKINLFNIEAEQIILGCLILNNNYYDTIDFLKSEFFYEPIHQLIYTHIQNLIKNNLLVDCTTLKNFFNNDKLIQTIGGNKYLSLLLSNSAGIIDIIDYAKIIQDLYKKRVLSSLLENYFNKIEKSTLKTKSNELIEELRNKIDKLEDNTDFKYNIEKIENILSDRLTEIKNAIENNEIFNKDIIQTGFNDFDKKFNGLTKGELVILAGCSSMGKTTVALQIALNLKKRGVNTIFFSLEMNKKQLINKILANQNKINSTRINHNNIFKSEIDEVINKSNLFLNSSLYTDDTYAINCNYLNKTLKRFTRKHDKIDVIIVDYLQIMQDTKEEKSRVREIGNITNGLKEIAKKFNCVVICLSQLSRSVESRENKHPILRDLRDSGEIEQIADMVIFVYRDHYYKKRKLNSYKGKKNEDDEKDYNNWISYLKTIVNDCELLVLKNRNGPCGEIKLYFEGKFSLVLDGNYNPNKKDNENAIPYQD